MEKYGKRGNEEVTEAFDELQIKVGKFGDIGLLQNCTFSFLNNNTYIIMSSFLCQQLFVNLFLSLPFHSSVFCHSLIKI